MDSTQPTEPLGSAVMRESARNCPRPLQGAGRRPHEETPPESYGYARRRHLQNESGRSQPNARRPRRKFDLPLPGSPGKKRPIVQIEGREDLRSSPSRRLPGEPACRETGIPPHIGLGFSEAETPNPTCSSGRGTGARYIPATQRQIHPLL